MIRYHARWVVPVTRPPIEHGTVAVADGRIAYVGDRRTAPQGVDHDLGDAVLLPGLVNAHTHLELTAMRGFLEDLPFRAWIGRLTRARRDVLPYDALVESAHAGIAEGLLAGITTYADTSESGAPFDAMRETGVRGILYQEVFGPDPAQCAEALNGLREKVDRLRAAQTPLVRVGVSPHAPYSVSDALFAATAAFARDRHLPVAVHIAESDEETHFVCDAAGGWADDHRKRGIPVVPRAASPVRLLERVGVLGARPLLIHCVRVTDTDIATIARHDASVAHCPASNAKLGHGIAPVAELLAAGVRVGLGSDSVASNNRMHLLDEARVAVLLQRARLGRHDALGAQSAIELATIGGARALGLDQEIGSLDVGKAADLAAFPLGDVTTAPVFDPAGALVFGRAPRASLVTVAGHVLVQDGALVAPARWDRVAYLGAALADWLRNASAGSPR